MPGCGVRNTVIIGDALTVLRQLNGGMVDCVVTSPPYYGLRDYGVAGQIGLEETPDDYVRKMVEVFREVRRVLKENGTCWLNLGDSYANDDKWGGASGCKNANSAAGGFSRARKHTGLKSKDLIGIPWAVAFALRADGWFLRRDIIWQKPNPMPESVRDRPTTSHEYIFLLTKSRRYFYDAKAIMEPCVSGPSDIRKMLDRKDRTGGKTLTVTNARYAANRDNNLGRRKAVGSPEGRNARSVWSITTKPYHGAHFATFPEEIPEKCIKAGCPAGGLVMDPFAGSGTTLAVAKRLGREYLGIELNQQYEQLINNRLRE
jgi:DNA modification methylase